MAHVHHSAIVVRDVEESLRFWRDGVGLEVMMDMHFDGDWSTLFGAPTNRLRSIFLGDPGRSDAGIVELVQFAPAAPAAPAAPSQPAAPPVGPGFFLLSCFVDVDPVLARLAALGLGGEPCRIVVHGDVAMATVVDPDGVLVELIGLPKP